MNTPRLVFACNHYIKETFNETLSKRIMRSENQPDSEVWKSAYLYRDVLVSPGTITDKGSIVITSIKCESSADLDKYQAETTGFTFLKVNPVKYIQGYDYDITSEFKSAGQYIYIDWRIDGRHPGDANTPDSLYYIVNVEYERHFAHQYSSTDLDNLCPRCCGDGWYVGLFEQNMANATLITEENRLVQSFFKYVYTRKTSTGYGSTILSIPGKCSTADEQTIYSLISTEIDNFSTYYKNQTSTMMLDGCKISSEEILHSYDIMSMDIDKEMYSVKVKIRFYTMAGSKLDVDIILPEEE